jgi:hypothetical protein
MTEAEIERLLFTGAQGADWGQSFTHTSGDETYDPETLVIQIRAGKTSTSKLIATSVPVDGVTAMEIDTTGTDLESGSKALVWAVPLEEGTELVTPDIEYWIEVRCEVNGVFGPIMKHRWYVPAMVAVP